MCNNNESLSTYVVILVRTFVSIDELVKHDQNGLLFTDGSDLSSQIQVNYIYMYNYIY